MSKTQKQNILEEIQEILRDLVLFQKQMLEAQKVRDKTQEARDKAQKVRDKAQEARDKALKERDKALKERDKALEKRDKAREKALEKRDKARDKAHEQAQQEMREIRESHKKARQELLEERKATDKALTKLERTLDKTNGNFNNKWGKFVENLVRGDLVSLLQERKIEVGRVQPRMIYPPYKGRSGGEFDLVAINGRELVIIEVKSTLEKADIDRFIKKLKIFKEIPTEYQNKDIYGGVAYLEVIKKANEYADTQGLFVIKSPGGKSQVSTIVNGKDFKPKAF